MKRTLPILLLSSIACCTFAQRINAPTTSINKDKVGKCKVIRTRPVFSDSKDAKVVYREKKAPGVYLNIVKNDKGQTFKVIDDKGMPKREATVRRNLVPCRSEGASFYEGFEDYITEYGEDWIPTGWEEINTEANKPTQEMLDAWYNNTWRGGLAGDGYWWPITNEGEKEMFIHFTYVKWEYDEEGNPYKAIDAAEQDEWLITPQIEVIEGQKLYFCAAIDIASCIYYDWGTSSFDKNNLLNDLEVLVSSDNKKTWTKIWSAWNDYGTTMSDDWLKSNIAKPTYYDFSANLDEYAGQTVNIAFRYINKPNPNGMFDGNSMAIDGIKVDYTEATGSYSLPYGALIVGMSPDWYIPDNAYTVLPAYVDNTWQATVSEDTDVKTWTFADAETGEMDDTRDGLITISNYAPSTVAMPQFTVGNLYGCSSYWWGINDEKPSLLKNGGFVKDTEGRHYGIGNYDYMHNSIYPCAFATDSYVFGTGGETYWGATQTAMANMFEKPASPLFIENMYMILGELDADEDALFTLDVREIENNGELGDIIAHGKATAKDATTYEADGIKLITLPFSFYETDNEGNETNKPFILSCDAMFEVSGYAENEKVRKFCAMCQYDNHLSGKNYIYARFKAVDQSGKTQEIFGSAADYLKNFNSSLCMSLTGTFGYLEADNYNISIDGDLCEKTITVKTCCAPDGMEIRANGKSYSLKGDTRIEWLTISAAPSINEDEIDITFKAEPTAEQRAMNITLNSLGIMKDFSVTQTATTAIADIVSNDGTTIIINDGNIEISTSASKQGECVKAYSYNGTALWSGYINSKGTAIIKTGSAKGVIMVTVGDKLFKAIVH